MADTADTYIVYLKGAERAASRLATDARHMTEDALSLTFYIGQLPYRYPFMTTAECAMEQAEIALSEALLQIRAIRECYAEKPIKLPVEDNSSITHMLSLEVA